MIEAGDRAVTEGVGRARGPGRLRFHRYPSHRDSGVAWLGDIPSHWNVKRLRYVVSTGIAKREIRGLDPETLVSFVPMEAVHEYGGLDLDETKSLSAVVDGYTYFRNGDVVVAKITPCFENGKGALAHDLRGGIGFGTTELHVLRPTPSVDARFLLYLTFSDHFRGVGTASMYGAGGQKRISDDFVRNSSHPIPSLPEQRTIADFLDRETARIDALVAKKERLIELLQEKRTALISRAVFDQQASTDRKRWKIRRLVRQVKRPLILEPDTEYREIGIRSWGKGIFHKDPVRGALLGEKSMFQLEPGDFVLNIVFAWEGAAAVVSQNEVGMVASHRFPTFRPSERIDIDYFLMVLQSEQGRRLMDVNSPGAAGRNKTLSGSFGPDFV